MDEAAISRYITDTFEGVEVVVASGDSFFFYDPDHNPDNRKFPFATLVANDNYDHASNLSRPSVFRLNIGVSKQTFRSLFASQTSPSGAKDGVDGNYDFTALDQIMPHPVYGRMYWVCVLNPSEATFQAVRPLLAEAYEMSVRKHDKKRPAEES
ncbi:MAG TPA: DUF6194 family protein [Gemmataceae bacterium]|jgi:hypothetical protein